MQRKPDPSDSSDASDVNDPDESEHPSPGQDPLEPCTPTTNRETDLLCNDGLDNDCDGTPDSYDVDCGAIECPAVSDWNGTDACNKDLPPNDGAKVCERFPLRRTK